MKANRILALALAAVTCVSVFTVSAVAASAAEAAQEATEEAAQTEKRKSHGKKEKVAEPENAVGKDAAKEAALKDAGVTAEEAGRIRSRVSETEDGTVVYKVRFSSDGAYYSYRIDALTGEVIEKTVQTAEEHAAAKENARSKADGTADESENGQFSGKKHGRRMKSETAEGEDSAEGTQKAPGRRSGAGPGAAAENGTSPEWSSGVAEQSAPSFAGQTGKAL